MKKSDGSALSTISRYEWLGLLFFALGHLIACYFSFGFNHPDEHFQILEFASHLSGLMTDSSILPWEFHSQIRPWFQPMLHALPMKILSTLGWYQPFDLAYFFRVFYSLLNLSALWLLWKQFKQKYDLDPRWFLYVGTLWFFPYLHVRNSSENLAGIMITFAFASFMAGRTWIQTGMLFGFAFLARYQIALGLLGMGISLLIRDRKVTLGHLKLLFGFLSIVALGIILDRIGYGNWVMSSYRYFKVNLIDGVAATYNPYPWYQYFIWILELNPFVSVPLLVGTVIYARRQKFDPMSAFVLTYFLIHLLIRNKEYRFLFPLTQLAVFMTAVALQKSRAFWFKPVPVLIYASTSLLGFCVSTLHGASLETLWSVHMVDRYAKPHEVWLSNRDYLTQFKASYYQIQGHQLKLFHDEKDLATLLPEHRPTKVLIDRSFGDAITQNTIRFLESESCALLTTSQPLWVFRFRKDFPIIDRLKYRAIFDCPKK